MTSVDLRDGNSPKRGNSRKWFYCIYIFGKARRNYIRNLSAFSFYLKFHWAGNLPFICIKVTIALINRSRHTAIHTIWEYFFLLLQCPEFIMLLLLLLILLLLLLLLFLLLALLLLLLLLLLPLPTHLPTPASTPLATTTSSPLPITTSSYYYFSFSFC